MCLVTISRPTYLGAALSSLESTETDIVQLQMLQCDQRSLKRNIPAQDSVDDDRKNSNNGSINNGR